MIRTLQSYVARELLKTFALTAIGLTLVFTLCLVAFNMIKAEVLSGMQMLKLLQLAVPLATTLTLPVAALFACAIVYGRLAFDNEFDACKASGINIHRLLAPAFGLSVVIAAFSFMMINFVLPKAVERIEAMVRHDIAKVVTQTLVSRGSVRQGPYVLHARHCVPMDDKSGVKGLHLLEAAFMQFEGEVLSRCGTAESVDVIFRTSPEGDSITAEATLHNVVAADLLKNRMESFAEQQFERQAIPSKLEEKTKWLDLQQLFVYLREPTGFIKARNLLVNLRRMYREASFYRWAGQQLTTGEKILVLADQDSRYEVRAATVEPDTETLEPALKNVTVRELFRDADGKQRTRDYQASSANMRVTSPEFPARDTVNIVLKGAVSFRDSLDPSKVNESRRRELDSISGPAHIRDAEKAMSTEQILGARVGGGGTIDYRALAAHKPAPLGLGDRVDDTRTSLVKGLSELGLEIISVLHSRLAFSVSVLVMLVMAATLGIIFRGGQLLTAFVISFLPTLLVVVLNIMGRQLAERPETFLPGILIIWAGIALLAVADLVILTRYLKR